MEHTERSAARHRYAEALANLAASSRPLHLADDLKPAGATDAEIDAAMAALADELKATPDDTTAAEAVLRAGEGQRRAARGARHARIQSVKAALSTIGITLADLRFALDATDDDQ